MFEILFDYATLRLIWWVLLGVLLIGFAITDGFDLGVGALLPFVAKTDGERRVAINTIAPTWEGNQVWFVLGGGAIFAAWPALYALSFSGFYLAMFLVLLALILRPVGFKYRSKITDPRWREAWDYALFIGGAVPVLIFGVAVGNTLLGVPFHFTDDLRPIYEGNLFGLLNPMAIFCGLVSVAMLITHGATWLMLKAEQGPITQRAQTIGTWSSLATTVLFAIGGLFLMIGWLGGYAVVGEMATTGPSNPLLKEVVADPQAWLANYNAMPILWVVPVLGLVGPLIAMVCIRTGRGGLAWIFSSLAIAGIIGSVGLSMFPTILPSSTNPAHSLMVWDASSSRDTLRNMLIATVLFLPLILGYTAWVYKVLWGKVTEKDVTSPGSAAY